MSNKRQAQNQVSSATKVMLFAVVAVIAVFMPFGIDADEQMASTLLWLYGGTFGTLVVGGLVADRKNRSEQRRLVGERQQELRSIAEKYNNVTERLEESYESERRQLTASGRSQWYFGTRRNASKEGLRRAYEQKYLNNKAAYQRESSQYKAEWNLRTAEVFKFKRYWKWVIAAGLIAEVAACNYNLSAADAQQQAQRSAMVEAQETKTWTAQSIPMPHQTDGSRYVSNPDGIVSQNTENQLNVLLKQMDDSLGIESVVAIVNHIQDQDIFRMAQDIFDTYHVGKNDRGLVMVLAYGDHLFRTHTGRSLEGDLTDIECSRLQREYLVPSMKAEMPDSGMLYLTQAIYNLLQGKVMPVMSALSSGQQDDDDLGAFGFCSLGVMFWTLFALYIARRYGMLASTTAFLSNPFAEMPTVVIGGGGGFGGGGGGFGGGSSGGGGATSSW